MGERDKHVSSAVRELVMVIVPTVDTFQVAAGIQTAGINLQDYIVS
jgi:hypothetical protein